MAHQAIFLILLHVFQTPPIMERFEEAVGGGQGKHSAICKARKVLVCVQQGTDL